MYAKFVIYDERSYLNNDLGVSQSDGSTETKVVPKTVEVFEGRRFSYRKIAVETLAGFNKISVGLGSYELLTDLPFDPEIADGPCEFEFILLSIYEKETHDIAPTHYIAAADSALFIMNESGKTIDKIVCRNDY